jgi:hypothetical protein
MGDQMKIIETVMLTQGIRLELVESNELQREWSVMKGQSVIFSDSDAHLVLMMVNHLIAAHSTTASSGDGETIITSQQ